MRRILFLGLCAIAIGFIALPAIAASGPGGLTELPRSACEAAGSPLQCFWDNIVCLAVLWFFAIVVIISFIMLLLAALKFMTAGGEANQVSDARKILTFAIIGLIVALLARVLVLVIADLLGIARASITSFFTC